jgi:KDO2-lipid IV(A) lauroyltransferase
MEARQAEGVRSSPFSDGLGPAAVYFLFRAGAAIAEKLPLGLGDLVARWGGALAYTFAREKRRIVRKNLARVIGDDRELDGVVKSAFESYARYWLETFRVGRYSAADISRMVECETTNVLERALASKRGVVIATAHFGFYDLAVSWLGVTGFPLTAVAEVLRPRALYEWFTSIRTKRGIGVIPASPKDEAMRSQMEVLRSGGGLALLSDRNLGRRGIWADLFGEATTVPAGPPLLVARTGAVLLSGAMYSTESGFRLDFEEIPYELSGDEGADAGSIAQTIALAIEDIVRKAPEQWHLFGTNWPSDEPHLPPRGAGDRP